MDRWEVFPSSWETTAGGLVNEEVISNRKEMVWAYCRKIPKRNQNRNRWKTDVCTGWKTKEIVLGEEGIHRRFQVRKFGWSAMGKQTQDQLNRHLLAWRMGWEITQRKSRLGEKTHPIKRWRSSTIHRSRGNRLGPKHEIRVNPIQPLLQIHPSHQARWRVTFPSKKSYIPQWWNSEEPPRKIKYQTFIIWCLLPEEGPL